MAVNDLVKEISATSKATMIKGDFSSSCKPLRYM